MVSTPPPSPIHIIKTGGTIEFLDPAYDQMNAQVMKLDTSIETYLNNLIKPHFAYTSETIFQKDSREITEEDRKKISDAIQSSTTANIILTHGTYTMRETAEFLEQHSFTNKKVIITGSMIPVMGFAVSDAGFNLGFAIAAFWHLEPGVYISMNGGIFRGSEATKNTVTFRFE